MKSLALLAVLLSASCATRIGHDKDENTYSAMEGSHAVEVAREDIVLSEITVKDATSKRIEDRLQVDFAFENRANYKVPFEFQVRWYNGAGEKPFNVGPWRPAFLGPGELKPMTLRAPTPTCVGWQVATRSPHTSN